MNSKIPGLHHVTAIASDPQRNLDFYVGLLGLRFVKRTVNFDDPGTYHFYFGDRRGTPGTILTFFPWPGARRGIRGTGQVEATAFAIPPNSIGFWLDRLKQQHVTAEKTPTRFGEEVIRLIDPDGLLIELIASSSHGQVDRGRTAPFRPSMRFTASTVSPPRWKVTKELRGYSPRASVIVWLMNREIAFALPRRTTRRRAESLTCFVCPTRAWAVSRQVQSITLPSGRRTKPSNLSGASIWWILATTSRQ